MTLVTYSLQAGIALALMYLFYRVFLERLTFYRANRLYMLGYTLLALALPFLDTGGLWPKRVERLSATITRLGVETRHAVPILPSGELPEATEPIDWIRYVLLAGMVVLSIRLLVQIFSLLRLWDEASLVGRDGRIRLFRLPYPLAPFSFGPNIFISPQTQDSPDLQRVIEHEEIHIRQAHTLDILLAQLLLVFQWWNPFAWLLNQSMRQNLEFLADQGVLDRGADRKEYQYLLLGVSGQGVPSISNPLNFSPLKNRILMMNKPRSGKVQAMRFLFALPLLVVLLVAASRHRPTPAGDGLYHFHGFAMDAGNLQPIAGVLITEKTSGGSATTDQNGYFRIDIPLGQVKDFLLINAIAKKTGFRDQTIQSTIRLDSTGAPATKGVLTDFGMAAEGPETHSFVTDQVVDNEPALLQKDPDAMRLAFNSEVVEQKEMTKIRQAFDSSPHIFYVIDGKSYVISEHGGFASVDGTVKTVFVNGKTPMTGEELNKRYTKFQVKSEGAYDAVVAKEKFGIDENVLVVNLKDEN